MVEIEGGIQPGSPARTQFPRKTESSFADSASMVTVGVPVCNEERFLEQTLRCIVAQDYRPLEVIITDNASTDGTQEIAERYAAQYDFVTYYRHEQNRGAVLNYQFVLDHAKGDYIAWLSGHDLWAENYISECMRILRDKDAVIAFTDTEWIGDGGTAPGCKSGYSDSRDLGSVERFFTVLWGNMHPIFGLIRLSAVRELGKLPACIGWDLVVLCGLALKGPFIHSPRSRVFRRIVRTAESHEARMARYRSADYALARSSMDRVLPLAKLPIHLIRVLLKSDIGMPVKVAALVALGASFPVRYLVGRWKAD
ncbi:MAG: glycosyltransferase family 2 protein [Gammaproteobacteria bacterium]|nr:glycosyltransferase family 2 protein [Gammaproteobacteria bacterium]